jgi:hypothetical protein
MRPNNQEHTKPVSTTRKYLEIILTFGLLALFCGGIMAVLVAGLIVSWPSGAALGRLALLLLGALPGGVIAHWVLFRVDDAVYRQNTENLVGNGFPPWLMPASGLITVVVMVLGRYVFNQTISIILLHVLTPLGFCHRWQD